MAKADDSAEEIVSVYAVGSEVKQMGVVGIHPGLFFFVLVKLGTCLDGLDGICSGESERRFHRRT